MLRQVHARAARIAAVAAAVTMLAATAAMADGPRRPTISNQPIPYAGDVYHGQPPILRNDVVYPRGGGEAMTNWETANPSGETSKGTPVTKPAALDTRISPGAGGKAVQ